MMEKLKNHVSDDRDIDLVNGGKSSVKDRVKRSGILPVNDYHSDEADSKNTPGGNGNILDPDPAKRY